MLEVAGECVWVLKTVTTTSQLSVRCFFPTEQTLISPLLRQKTTKQILHTLTIFMSNIHTWLKNEKMFYLVPKYIHTKKSSETGTFWVILDKKFFGAGCVSVFKYITGAAQKNLRFNLFICWQLVYILSLLFLLICGKH